MKKLLILCLALIFIIIIITFIIVQMYNYQEKVKKIISHYIDIYKREKDMKQRICLNNLDCNNGTVCQMDIDRQKRCFDKDNMIQRICTKLII